MPAIRGPRLTTLRATIGLLYRSHPRAFVVSAVASLAEPLFFPAFILLLQRLLLQITTGGAAAPGHYCPRCILHHPAAGGLGGDQQADHAEAASGTLSALRE